ncbi:MAG: hypothetical protein ISP90_12005 [Nevskia sp.]|nr:hypothetical protein [Nevskia sp.]
MGEKQQKGGKGKKASKADALVKGGKKAGVELTEKDLDKVTGGAALKYNTNYLKLKID